MSNKPLPSFTEDRVECDAQTLFDFYEHKTTGIPAEILKIEELLHNISVLVQRKQRAGGIIHIIVREQQPQSTN